MSRYGAAARVGVALLGAGPLWAALALGTTARADAGERIPAYEARVQLAADGSMRVRETIRYAFAGADHHGIYRDLRTQFRYDPGRDGNARVRSYPVSDVQVSSPSGAPSDVQVDTSGSVTHLRIGDANSTVQGTQTYVLSYTVRGVINRIAQPQDQPGGAGVSSGVGPHDELYWNITGGEWQVPIDRATVTVEAPRPATQVLCYRGEQGSTDTCTGTAGATSSFSTTALQPGQGMSVLLAYPTGTITDVAPILSDVPKKGLARFTQVSPVAAGGSGALLAVLAGGMGLLVRRRGRDAAYVGLTPGLAPVAGQVVPERPVTRQPRNATVQFTPPRGLLPGQIGTLVDEVANPVDVTATIIDLAVRGFLRIEEVGADGGTDGRAGGPPEDWRLVMTQPAPSTDGLRPYELRLLQAIFRDRESAELRGDLKDTFAGDLRATQLALYQEVTSLGWFRDNPESVRKRFRGFGIGLVVVGFALAAWGGFSGSSVNVVTLAGAVFAGGLVVAALAGRMPARTAAGSAVLAQAAGFRRYLETAEADQIRFEEGQDVFSRYLPYAIVFGVAERWSKVFDELARRGADVSRPDWYVGYSPTWSYLWLGQSMGTFESSAGTSLASTPAASGSSGFSSGGGFSGGGGGGGGGGSW
jgi:hypothetical protein